jgi:hypothetical protein
MPAEEFTKKADTPKKKRQWEHVYLGMKKAGKSPAAAVKGANAAVKRDWKPR